jgi:hypothetical protein
VRLEKEGASKADQLKADTEMKAAQKAKRDAENAKKREQARVAAAKRKKEKEEARIATQSKAVSLPARGGAAGWDTNQQPKAARTAPRLDRAALWAKCDAMIARGARDDDLTRPGRVEYCVNNGGNR